MNEDVRRDYAAVSELFSALASPVRCALVHELTSGPKAVHELVEATGLPQPLVSQHLRTLRASRLLEHDRHGREVQYRLIDEHVSHIFLDAHRHSQERHDDHH